MAYLNSTIQNGNLVSNKKGMQVSRDRHKGMAFVNASPEDIGKGRNPATASSSKAISGNSRPLQTRFVPESIRHDGRRMPKSKARALKKQSNTQVISMPRKDPGTILGETQVDDCESMGTPPYYTYSLSTSTPARPEDCVPKLEFDDWHHDSAARAAVLRALPAWATISLSSHLSDQNKRLLCFAFAEAPVKKYPFDTYGILTYNPLETNQNYINVVTDPVLTQIITAIGVVYNAIKSGKGHSAEITGLMGQLCGFTNKRVETSRKDNKFSFNTVECVIIMALLSTYLGHSSQWHMHMRALRYIVNTTGGLHSVSDMLATSIHKSDICGAIATASQPYLPMDRRHAPLPLLLSAKQCDITARTLQRRLGLCRISREVVENIVSVAIFGQNWSAAYAKNAMVFEPHPMMEEFYALQHYLFSVPGPLRDSGDVEELTRNLALECENPPQSEGCTSLPQRSLSCQGPAVNRRLEHTLRIAVLLFLNQQGRDAAMGDSACIPLLTLLTQDLQLIVAELQKQRASEISNDPVLLPDFGMAATMRPVLIWICLVAHTLQVVNNFYGAECYETRRQGGSVYRDVLLEVLGPAADDVALLEEDDLEVCRVLDVRILRGEKWDEHTALRSILGHSLH